MCPTRNKVFSIIFFILSFFGFLGGLNLAYSHFQTGNSCPVLYSIPACYFITFLFFLILISAFIKNNLFQKFILGILILGFLFSGFASISNILGTAECPKTSIGIPMCYIAFFLFSSLIYLKISQKYKKN